MGYKILMVTSFYPPYYVGGACMHVYYLANMLAKKGHEVHVLYSKDSYRLVRKGEPKGTFENHKNVHLHQIEEGIWSPLMSYVFDYTSKKAKKVLSGDFDIIHYHNVSLFGPGIFSQGTAPKIYTNHDHWLACPLNDMFRFGRVCRGPGRFKCQLCLLRNKRPFQLWRFFPKIRRALKHITKIISPSDYMKRCLISYGVRTPIDVIPNFVDVPKGEKVDQKGYFIYVGMLEEHKGIRGLLECFKGTEHRLFLAGKGSLEKYVTEFTKKNHNVTYLGFVYHDKMYAYIKNSRALILPSIYIENNPLVLMEALSIGVPILGSNGGGIPEIVNKMDGTLVFNSFKDLGNKLDTLKKYDPKKIKKIWKDNYSPKSFYKRYTGLIKDVIKTAKR